jgi:hypothetical protein
MLNTIRKITIVLVVLIVVFLALYVPHVNSADLDYYLYNTETHLKLTAIKSVLERNNSPLQDEADVFIEVCIKYNIDCYLLPAIAGAESSYGNVVRHSSYNPFGWGGGQIIFPSWEESIRSVAEGLNDHYISVGLKDVDSIGTKYATSSEWSTKIKTFMAELRAEEEKQRLYFEEIYVK